MWLQILLGWFSKHRLDVSKEFCQSFKVCHFKVHTSLSHLASMLLISQDLLAGFLITLLQNGPFASNSFFRPKSITKVAITKTKSAKSIIVFFSFLPFLLLTLSFSPFLFLFLLWFWSFSGLRNMPFDAFSLKWLQILLGWFSKNRLNIHTYKHIYIQDSWKADGIGHRQPSLVMYVTWISQASQQ